MDIFEFQKKKFIEKNAPLADRMRPRTLDEFVGQDHIIGHGRLLRRAIQIDQLSSIIFYGPPGTGKTTLARIIANTTKSQFLSINAVLAGIKDIRDAIETAQKSLSLYGKRTILFIDEVHRFNKAQQDALLPHVENGILILIGATTENPYFEVNKALVSRSRVFQLKKLTSDDLRRVAHQALHDPQRGYASRNICIDDDAMDHVVNVANGDARGVLNALELAVETTQPSEDATIHITREVMEDSIQQRAVLYDKDGDAHYDTISAFIKSLRGSDPDAALYWMAKMLYAGEDPRFIFRRMIIFAGEDIGLADPRAIQVVIANAQAFEYVGLPEGRFHLSHACLYCATAPKSNSTFAFFDAIDTITKETEAGVPDHLKDSSRDKEGLGHGKGYLYPHAYRDHWVAQQYLPDLLQGKTFYEASDQGYEKKIQDQVRRRREALLEAMVTREDADAFGGECGKDEKESSSKEAWERRTSGTTGEQLAQIRDYIIEKAAIKPESLVLDCYARSGLLTFEVLRRVPYGCVWAMTYDTKAFDTLTAMAKQCATLEKPQIIQTSFQSCDEDIRHIAGQQVAFDSIIGRNILSQVPDKAEYVRRIAALLAQGATMVLAEQIHRESQRLSEIISFPDDRCKKKWLAAENALFSNNCDTYVNWDAALLEKELSASTAFTVHTVKKTFMAKRHCTPSDIAFWLRESKKAERRSLGDYLRSEFKKDEISALHTMLDKQLARRDIQWKSVVVFFVLKNEKTAATFPE